MLKIHFIATVQWNVDSVSSDFSVGQRVTSGSTHEKWHTEMKEKKVQEWENLKICVKVGTGLTDAFPRIDFIIYFEYFSKSFLLKNYNKFRGTSNILRILRSKTFSIQKEKLCRFLALGGRFIFNRREGGKKTLTIF